MIFHDFAARLLGSKAKLKVLNYLLAPYPDGQFYGLPPASERELGNMVGLSHTAVQKSFQDFADANLTKPAHVGNAKMWIINGQSYAFELLTKEPFVKICHMPPLQKLESMIRQKLCSVPGAEMAIIYGSIAARTETTTSDIDIVVLAKDDKVKEAAAKQIEELDSKCRALFGNMLSVVFVNKDPLKGRWPPWMSEALDKGVKVMLK